VERTGTKGPEEKRAKEKSIGEVILAASKDFAATYRKELEKDGVTGVTLENFAAAYETGFVAAVHWMVEQYERANGGVVHVGPAS
jgi:hypothetical protein